MIYRFRHRQSGEHVHVRVFVGEHPDSLASAGTLAFRTEEWWEFQRTMQIGKERTGNTSVWVEFIEDVS